MSAGRAFTARLHVDYPDEILIRPVDGMGPVWLVRIEIEAVRIKLAIGGIRHAVPEREFKNHGFRVRRVDRSVQQVEVTRKLWIRSVRHVRDEVALDDIVIRKQADNAVTDGYVRVVESDAPLSAQDNLKARGLLVVVLVYSFTG